MHKYAVIINVGTFEANFFVAAETSQQAEEVALEEAFDYASTELCVGPDDYDGCPDPNEDPEGYDDFIAEIVGNVISVEKII